MSGRGARGLRLALPLAPAALVCGSSAKWQALIGPIAIATGIAEQDHSFDVTLRNVLIVGRLPAGKSEIQIRAKAAEVIIDKIIEGNSAAPSRARRRPAFELTGLRRTAVPSSRGADHHRTAIP